MDIFRISRQELSSCLGKFIFAHGREKNISGAYELSDKCKLILMLPRRLALRSVEISILDEACASTLLKKNPEYEGNEDNFDTYSLTFDAKKLGVGLYFGLIKLNTLAGTMYAIRNGEHLVFTESLEAASFQLSVSDFKYSSPKNKYGGIIYHIFVDRFSRDNVPYKLHRDAVYVDDWNAEIPEYPAYPGAFLKNNYFYGGTLRGVAEKLPYIASLGVDTIYLSPIFRAYSNHKYDTGDYMQVDESFGGDEALQDLIDKAKSYGIGIILDGVFNHTGADSKYFNKYGNYTSVGAFQSKSSPYYSWYDFKSYPNDYTSWWGIEILPRINPSVKSCEDYFTGKGGVIEKYAKMGIDGFRLDVVDELADTFVAKIKSTLNKENKDSVLYGEVWEDASNKIAYDTRKTYYLGRELDGVMNYPAREAVISYIKQRDTSALEYLINEIIPNAPKRIRNTQMNLLGTHDTDRILTILGGEPSQGKSNDYLVSARMDKKEYSLAVSRLMSAYTLISTLPGIPSIFYGDEAGMEGYHDPFNRRTYPWGNENKDLLAFYKKIGKIRRKYEPYREGDFDVLYLDKDLFIFKRQSETQTLLTVINNSDKEIKLSFKSQVHALISNKRVNCVNIAANTAEIVNTNKNQTLNIL